MTDFPKSLQHYAELSDIAGFTTYYTNILEFANVDNIEKIEAEMCLGMASKSSTLKI